MFCGYSCIFIWPKKGSPRRILKEEQIYVPYIVPEPPSANGEKATIVRFRKPGRIYFKRYATLLPEPGAEGNPVTDTAEE